jgi:hypothetical protein
MTCAETTAGSGGDMSVDDDMDAVDAVVVVAAARAVDTGSAVVVVLWPVGAAYRSVPLVGGHSAPRLKLRAATAGGTAAVAVDAPALGRCAMAVLGA